MKTDDTQRFFNRELSWLAFNRRVLAEAADASVPLLERVFFLTITASNLDEFVMVRMGGLHLQRAAGIERPDPAGLTPACQLERLRARLRDFIAAQYGCFDALREALDGAGLRLCRGPLCPSLREALTPFFETDLYSVLSPVGIQPGRPFPLLASGALYLVCRLKAAGKGGGIPGARLALIRLNVGLPRLIPVPGTDRDGARRYVWLEDLVVAFLDRLLPGRTVLETGCCRLTRNADLAVDEEFAADLSEAMQRVLRQRRQSPGVRLELSAGLSKTLSRQLRAALGVATEDGFEMPGPLDLTGLGDLSERRDLPALRYPPWPPQPSPMLDLSEDLFAQLARRDALISLPYESVDPLIRLLEAAAADADVLAIKIVLYRTARNSVVVRALRDAVLAGKSVTVLVELKARFDEAANIAWARELEAAGAQIVYGIKRLKTHAKVALVVRREATGLVRYVHLGTGNYNENTARAYTDVGILTADAALAADVAAFFHAVTGCSEPQPLRLLALAPLNLRERLIERITAEARLAAQGQSGIIRAKLNNLVDPAVIEALYAASCEGVQIELCVRGICCLRPGLSGLSENIRVISIVDRFLEHSRLFYFHNGGDARLYLSSADWMPRNLDRRIELMAPVEDPACRRRLLKLLRITFADTAKARELQPDGSYVRCRPEGDAQPVRSQEMLYRAACEAAQDSRRALRTVFEPHRPESLT